MQITPGNIYEIVEANMPPEEIAHWCSDLYIKKTPYSESVISNYQYKNLVHVFRDQITGAPWYEIPFCYPGRI